MTLPCDTLKQIQFTAQEAQKAETLPQLSGDGRQAFVRIGSEIKEFAIGPPVRQHVVHTLADLISYADANEDQPEVVWFGPVGVVLVIDDADRRDRVVFPLSLSPRFETLRHLQLEKEWFSQPNFVRMLRVDLGLDNVAVVSKFRKIQWASGSESEGNIQHGSDRVGKSVLAKVQNIDDLPDELNVSIPVYQQAGERDEYIVKCLIEIDTVNQLFQLVPRPDELERVVDLAQDGIRNRLTAALGTAFPIYYGQP